MMEKITHTYFFVLGLAKNRRGRPRSEAMRFSPDKVKLPPRPISHNIPDDSDVSDDNETDTRLLDVLSDVQKFLGQLNTESLTENCKDMKHSLSDRIDFVTRRSKSRSR